MYWLGARTIRGQQRRASTRDACQPCGSSWRRLQFTSGAALRCHSVSLALLLSLQLDATPGTSLSKAST